MIWTNDKRMPLRVPNIKMWNKLPLSRTRKRKSGQVRENIQQGIKKTRESMDTHTGVLTEDLKRREKLGQKIAQAARKVSVWRWSIKYLRMWQEKWSHSPLAIFNSSYSSLSCSSSSSAHTFGGRTVPDLRLFWNALKTISTISTIHSDQPWFTLCVE